MKLFRGEKCLCVVDVNAGRLVVVYDENGKPIGARRSGIVQSECSCRRIQECREVQDEKTPQKQ